MQGPANLILHRGSHRAVKEMSGLNQGIYRVMMCLRMVQSIIGGTCQAEEVVRCLRLAYGHSPNRQAGFHEWPGGAAGSRRWSG